jgi:hypothetical protein
MTDDANWPGRVGRSDQLISARVARGGKTGQGLHPLTEVAHATEAVNERV